MLRVWDDVIGSRCRFPAHEIMELAELVSVVERLESLYVIFETLECFHLNLVQWALTLPPVQLFSDLPVKPVPQVVVEVSSRRSGLSLRERVGAPLRQVGGKVAAEVPLRKGAFVQKVFAAVLTIKSCCLRHQDFIETLLHLCLRPFHHKGQPTLLLL